jgi:hypothetical protein
MEDESARARDHGGAVAGTSHLGVLGWREWVALPDLGMPAIRAKVDTGARSSSLHVEASETFWQGDQEWVRFELRAERHAPAVACAAPIVDRREVTDSSGHRNLRVFIRTRVGIGGHEHEIELNLTRRHQMLFPMLLGRTALSGRWLVDPAASFTRGDGPEGQGAAILQALDC